MSIIYSENSGFSNAAIGKLETPIKMVIEHESDLQTKRGGICDWLFNVERSTRFGETIVGQNEFGVFSAAEEGAGAENDSIEETYRKFIEHIQFMKEFTITAQMMEDANYGVAADARRRAENFTRAYYKTMHKICEYALANGTQSEGVFAKAKLDLTAPDGLPLFASNHLYGGKRTNGTQSNYFFGDIFKSGTGDARVASAAVFEEALGELAAKIRNMKDENGDILGYTADTIILPGNRPMAEAIAKKVCGSEGALGNGYNDINLQYGNWNIVVMPNWQTEDDRLLVMSSEANKNLSGNMFFNRVPLTVSNWVDNHTGNYIWNGRCRFGVGFGSYKHILLAVDSESAVENATKM
ncbi:MAG: hypothetical protein E7657_00805 [Ruminococcaceae bacterium]|nr:hypothetical protein [Oscillospiraceae bacterium]